MSVNSIVIHYTANPGTDAEANRNYFNNLANQDGVENPTYASSNFVIGIDGEIIAAVPIDEVAYASNQLNETSLSIENCHPDETGQFTDATYQSLIKLTAWLCHHYGLTSENVIRHYDVTGKACPAVLRGARGRLDAAEGRCPDRDQPSECGECGVR